MATLTRREMLKLVAAGAATSLLAACAPKAPAPTEAPVEEPAEEPAEEPEPEVEEPEPTEVPEPTAAPAPEMITLKSIHIGIQGWQNEDLMAPVLAAVNAKVQDDGLNVTWVPQVLGDWGTYAEKSALMFAAGDDFDWGFAAQWMNMMQYIANGYIIPLEDLVEVNFPNLRKVVGDRIVDANDMLGHMYGIPCGDGSNAFAGRGVLVREDLRLKYEIPEPTSYESLGPFLEAIKENEPDMIPIGPTSMGEWGMLNPDYAPTNDFIPIGNDYDPGAIVDAQTLFEVTNQYDSDEYRWACGLAYEWQQKGYLSKEKLPTDFTLSKGKLAAMVTNGIVWAATQQTPELLTYAPEGKIRAFPAKPCFWEGTCKISNSFVVWNFQCFNKAGKHPAEGLQFYNWLYADTANSDLLEWGIEGVNWIDAGPGLYSLPEGIDPTANYSYPWYLAGTSAQKARVDAGTFPEDIEMFKYIIDSNNYVPSPLIGFTFDAAPVAEIIAQETAIFEEYQFPLSNGNLDPEVGIPELNERLLEAGLEEELAEKNRQIQAFLAG